MKRIALFMLMAIVWAASAHAEMDGFPKSYDRPGGDGFDHNPLVCDVNRDGSAEIIVTAKSSGSAVLNQILVFDASNSTDPIWSLQVPQQYIDQGFELSVTPTVADGNGDGDFEIIAPIWKHTEWAVCPISTTPPASCRHWHGGSCPGPCTHFYSRVCDWEFAGGSPGLIVGPQIESKLTLGSASDLDADGNDELVFVGTNSYGCSNDGTNDPPFFWGHTVFTMKRGSGGWTIDHDTQLSNCLYNNNPPDEIAGQTQAAVGDVNGDLSPEICVILPGGQDGMAVLHVWSYDLAVVNDIPISEGWPLNETTAGAPPLDDAIPAPILCDINQDGNLEALFVVRQQQSTSSNGTVIIANPLNGTYQPVPMPGGYVLPGETFAAVANGPGIDNLDFYVGGYVTASPSGSEFLRMYMDFGQYTFAPQTNVGWPKGPYPGFGTTRFAPAIVSTTDDSALELVVPMTTTNSAFLRSLRLDNRSATDPDVLTLGNTGYGQTASSTPTAADINGDGIEELVFVTPHSSSVVEIHAVSLGRAEDAQLHEWNGFQNGPKHTGLYAQPVTGTQTTQNVKWSGRITVHGHYSVPTDFSLTIEPGTVVEFMPSAALDVSGVLHAEDPSGMNPIYFKGVSEERWEGINLLFPQDATLWGCTIHGGECILVEDPGWAGIQNCHIYDMTIGVTAWDASTSNFEVQFSVIENCEWGIIGVASAGWFNDNTVQYCQRAGVVWNYDLPSELGCPYFARNVFQYNGVGEAAIAGGWFSHTSADLECNQFLYNQPVQILCEAQGNVIMNVQEIREATNILSNYGSSPYCASCNFFEMPAGYSPLMWIVGSNPLLAHGGNLFHFDANGTYIFDPTQPAFCTAVYPIPHDVTRNKFEPDNNPPGHDSLHFCPPHVFTGGTSKRFGLCAIPIEPLEGAAGMYQAAAALDTAGAYAEASAEYRNVTETFPDSEQALWAVHDRLRSELRASGSSASIHDTLLAMSDRTSLPPAIRASARREAVSALIAGSSFTQARTELDAIRLDSTSHDSLWAVITLQAIDLMELRGSSGKRGNTADARLMRDKLKSFQQNLLRITGKRTDEELKGTPALPVSKDLASAYPNPFNSTVTIKLDLPSDANVKLDIFNLLGQRVSTLVERPLTAGTHQFQWNADAASSGVYFYRLSAGSRVESHKLLLLK